MIGRGKGGNRKKKKIQSEVGTGGTRFWYYLRLSLPVYRRTEGGKEGGGPHENNAVPRSTFFRSNVHGGQCGKSSESGETEGEEGVEARRVAPRVLS